jgi:D-serine deaminase-like pyridoxal phosphate-dependent protein
LNKLVLFAALGFCFPAHADGLRDPTRPPLAQSHATALRESAPVLSAVLTFGGTRTAIFNGQLVRGGSVVGAYIIDSVLEDGVRYRHANQWHELHLVHAATTFKKPAAETQLVSSGVPR